MKVQTRMMSLYLAAMLMTTTIAAFAQPKEWAAQISPFVLADDLLILHFDLTKIDSDLAVKHAIELAAATQNPIPDEQIARMTGEEFTAGKQTLIDAGASDVFILGNQQEIWRGQFSVILPSPNGKSAKIVEWFASKQMHANTVGNSAYFGSEQRLLQLRQRPENQFDQKILENAFSLVESTDAQVVVLLNDTLRALAETNPSTEKLLGISIGSVSAKIKAVAAAVSLNPKLSARLIIQASDQEDAAELEVSLRQMVTHVSKDEVISESLGPLLGIARSLLPKRNANLVETKITDVTKFVQENIQTLSEPRYVNRSQAINTIKQIALAHLNFESAYGSFVPPASFDKNGKPLLSWRVYLLPYLEYQSLYEQFHLDEPWDSPHNIKLVEKMPEVYRSRGFETTEQGKTCYLLPTGPGTLFDGPKGKLISDVKDGLSKTLLVVEVAPEHAVPWSKPADWELDPSRLKRPDGEGFLFSTADAFAGVMPPDTSAEKIRLMSLINDGKSIPEE